MNTDQHGYGNRLGVAGLAEAGPKIVCTCDLRPGSASPATAETDLSESVSIRVHPWLNGSDLLGRS